MKHGYRVAVVGLGAGLLMAAVPPNPNDQTKPTVVTQVRDANGLFVPASKAKLTNGTSGGVPFTLDIICNVADPDGGLQSASLTFASTTDVCIVNSAIFTGSFPLSGLPANDSRTYKKNAQGLVQESTFFFSTVKAVITCKVPGQQGIGTPKSLKATCQAKNWSNNAAVKSAQAVLTIDTN
ncbi:MAG TPA: hypothetical protein VNR39_09335 [Pseudolabrys sp.]|nr:hypothetical protein [Pseudolabrys sp.]